MAESNQYYVKYPVLQVRPWGLLAYDRIEWLISRRKKDRPTKHQFHHSSPDQPDTTPQAYTGTLTPYAKKKLKRAISLMVASAKDKEAPNFKTGGTFKFKVNFITLTLPGPQGKISDKEIKKHCLDNWIKRAKRKHKLNSYVWRAERQKNGNLHFHIITDTWIHYEKIRNDWNDVCNHFGWIDKFEAQHGHRNPNSTDVHAVWKVKNLTQYFIKYMSKNSPEQDVIQGKLWDCSKNLKTKKNCEVLMESEALEQWTKASEDPECELKSDANYAIIFLSPDKFDKYVTGELRARWMEYLAIIRGDIHEYSPQPPHDHCTLRAA